MFDDDLGELACGRGGVDALSNEVTPGDGTDLPTNWLPETCNIFSVHNKWPSFLFTSQ